MKSIKYLFILCITGITALIFTSCKKEEVSEVSLVVEESSDSVVKLFDNFNDIKNGEEKLLTADSVNFEIPEFPDVVFNLQKQGFLTAKDKNGDTSLYGGMPIWSIYLYDLTGDKLPELCSTVSFGSGIVDDYVIVYDYAEGKEYSLRDRTNYDYYLRMEDGELKVVKSEYNTYDSVVATGSLELRETENGWKLTMVDDKTE